MGHGAICWQFISQRLVTSVADSERNPQEDGAALAGLNPPQQKLKAV
jgi:hypothetical protein